MLALEITLCLLDVSQRGLRRAQRRDAVTVAMAAETFSFFPQARVCLKLFSEDGITQSHEPLKVQLRLTNTKQTLL